MLAPDTRILLTGASGGLGKAIAERLARQQVELILSGRNAAVLDQLGQSLDAETVVADLSERAQIERLLERAGPVDILIANAALPASGTIDDFSEAQVDRALDVNLRAPMLMARALLGPMLANRSGHIVFISSLSGKLATPGAALYSATKFGLRGFASGLRQDLHGSGVGVSTVFPGAIRGAGMWADSGVRMPAIVGTGTPQQVAAAVQRAIERDSAEIDVAPLHTRVASRFSQLTPSLNAAIGRRFGAGRLAAEVATAQRGKR